MKAHLQKTRTQNGKVIKFNIPECGKKGSSNAFLRIVSLELFKSLDSKDCCVNCLAVLK